MNTLNEKIITNELINNFKIYFYEEERGDNTIEKYMRDIRFFREWLKDRSIEKSVIIGYKKELCERYSVKSVNSTRLYKMKVERSIESSFKNSVYCDVEKFFEKIS